jgi:hypothetical protein
MHSYSNTAEIVLTIKCDILDENFSFLLEGEMLEAFVQLSFESKSDVLLRWLCKKGATGCCFKGVL